MLSLRQVASVVWTFLAFMVAAALVLNLRYKTVGEGEYFDTWTGQIRPTERVKAPEASSAVVLGVTGSESGIALRAERLRWEQSVSDCSRVRFAFPAPEPSRRY